MNQKTLAAGQHRGLIELRGEESCKFLQGQVTCDIDSLAPNQIMYGAHCSPKGRVIFLFCARLAEDQSVILETHPSVLEIAIASLSKYAVFFKTEISDISHLGLSSDISQSDLERIRSGRADITIETSELFIPQMLNLDVLEYISFSKGCYTGQEVVARAHYRGTVKRRMYYLQLASSSIPTPGVAILDHNDKSIGNIVNAAMGGEGQVEALAILSADALDCKALCVASETIAVSQLPLPYQIP